MIRRHRQKRKARQLDEQVWDSGQGFDIHHKPEDDKPCIVNKHGVCTRVAHLFPLAKGTRNRDRRHD